jgi:hypothetical protein
MNKTNASKRRTRRDLANLPVEDKLRIVEQLREDGVTSLAKATKEPGQASIEAPQPKPSLFEIIRHTADGRPRVNELRRGSDDEKNLAAEVETIFVKRERGSEALRALFPQGIPLTLAFFDRLNDLHMRMGWGETSHRATGLLLSLALDQLSQADAEILLNEFPRQGNPFFFQALESLNVLAAEKELRPTFAAKWFPALVRRVGNDLASGGLWKFLGAYCEQHPKNALEILEFFSATKDEEGISVAAFILGTVRSLDLNQETSASFSKLQTQFLNAADASLRSIYYRSWVQTAWRGKIHKTDLESLTERVESGTSEERDQMFWIVCRSLLSPSVPSDCFEFGWGWLREKTSANISPTAKYHVIDFATQLSAAKREAAGALALAVQPVLAEDKGIWQRFEQFLVSWLETDLPGFNNFCIKLAEKSARQWLEVLKTPQSFEWLLSEMRGKDVENLVGQLVLSSNSACRKLGLFFFDKLEMTKLPITLFQSASENQLRVAFYELQRDIIHGPSIARFLIVLTQFIERCGPEFQREFYDELVLQSKNYSGACRAEFERRANELPMLKTVLGEADRYFQALLKINESSINSMVVPGWQQAARLYARKFSNEIAKGRKQYSVFLNLFKNVQLLYGKSWSSFHDGKLGEKSDLQLISSSYEIPRLEEIDPEGMALRRIHAFAAIRELTKSLPDAEEGE